MHPRRLVALALLGGALAACVRRGPPTYRIGPGSTTETRTYQVGELEFEVPATWTPLESAPPQFFVHGRRLLTLASPFEACLEPARFADCPAAVVTLDDHLLPDRCGDHAVVHQALPGAPVWRTTKVKLGGATAWLLDDEPGLRVVAVCGERGAYFFSVLRTSIEATQAQADAVRTLFVKTARLRPVAAPLAADR
jgi:hypothetical protein